MAFAIGFAAFSASGATWIAAGARTQLGQQVSDMLGSLDYSEFQRSASIKYANSTILEPFFRE